MKLSVITPCKNEEKNVVKLHKKISETLKDIKFEIIFIDEKLQDLIASNASMQELKSYVTSQGTRFLRDDVIRLIKEGVTTVDEARKILFSVN